MGPILSHNQAQLSGRHAKREGGQPYGPTVLTSLPCDYSIQAQKRSRGLPAATMEALLATKEMFYWIVEVK